MSPRSLLAIAASFTVLLLAAACGSVDARPDFARARELVGRSTGADTVYDPAAPPAGPALTPEVLGDGLSLAEALRAALLDNRQLQAGFQAIGIARAELEQSGLLANPVLGFKFLLPDSSASANVQVDLLQGIADLWRMPRRQAMRAAELDGTVFRVSRQAGELVAATKDAYYELVASRQLAVVANAARDLAVQLQQAVQQQIDAGVASAADAAAPRLEQLFAELERQQADRAVLAAERQLAVLLGYAGDLHGVALVDALPPSQAAELDAEGVIAAALRERLDLAAAAAAVRAAEADLGLQRRGLWQDVGVGAAYEKPEGSSSSVVGPALALQLPVFDQNQAQVSKAGFLHAQAVLQLQALQAEVAQDVREASGRARSAAESARHVDEVLVPEAGQAAARMQSAFAAGDASVLQLLEVQRGAVRARRASVDARLEAVRATTALERAAGAPWERLVDGG